MAGERTQGKLKVRSGTYHKILEQVGGCAGVWVEVRGEEEGMRER